MSRTIETTNPATGQPLATYDLMSDVDLDAALDRACAGFERWRQVPIEGRADRLRAWADVLDDQADELAGLATDEMGKPITESKAEVAKCATALRWVADNAPALLTAETRPSDAEWSGVRFDPLGVVAAVMPWNFPYWQVIRFASCALAAGNVGVVKHAANTTGTNLALAESARVAGIDDGVFSALVVDHDQIASIIGDDRVAAVTLTGSEGAGRVIARLAGEALKPCVTELGGSDPFVVLDDADLDVAVTQAIKSRFQNNGQSCIAAKRFVVAEAVADSFVARCSERIGQMTVGDPRSTTTDIGPLARHDLRDDLADQVRATVEAGAQLVVGGVVPEMAGDLAGGAFYAPTLLDGVTPDMVAGTEETFGPVAAVIRVADDDEAIAVANSTRFGLGSAVCTTDPDRAARFEAELRAGAVFVNGMVRSDPRLPFGGVGASGFGRELSIEGLRAFTNIKTIHRS